MKESLKPCPFCGSKNVKAYSFRHVDFFGCKSCGACVSFKDPDGSKDQVDNPFESWNRRVASNFTVYKKTTPLN